MIRCEKPASRSQLSAGYVGSAGHAVQIEILNNLRAAMVGVSLEFARSLAGHPYALRRSVLLIGLTQAFKNYSRTSRTANP